MLVHISCYLRLLINAIKLLNPKQLVSDFEEGKGKYLKAKGTKKGEGISGNKGTTRGRERKREEKVNLLKAKTRVLQPLSTLASTKKANV